MEGNGKRGNKTDAEEEAEPATEAAVPWSADAALPCGARRVRSQDSKSNKIIFEIRDCDGREREKRQHNRCGLGRGGGTRHRSALAALADADLALRRVKLIQMENKRQHIWGRDYRCLQALVCCPAFVAVAELARSLDWHPRTILSPASLVLLVSTQAVFTTRPLSGKKSEKFQQFVERRQFHVFSRLEETLDLNRDLSCCCIINGSFVFGIKWLLRS